MKTNRFAGAAARSQGGARPKVDKAPSPLAASAAEPLPHRPLAEVTNDPIQLVGLVVFRFVAAGYHTGDMQCIDSAHGCASAHLGAEHSGSFVGRMTALVRALREERTKTLHFLPAPCCRATADECMVLMLLAAIRRRDQLAHAGLLRELTGRIEAPATEEFVTQIARDLDLAAERLSVAAEPIPAPAALH